jgi:hypothetical protein
MFQASPLCYLGNRDEEYEQDSNRERNLRVTSGLVADAVAE